MLLYYNLFSGAFHVNKGRNPPMSEQKMALVRVGLESEILAQSSKSKKKINKNEVNCYNS